MLRPDILLPYAAGALAVLFWGATPAVTALILRDMSSPLLGPARLLLSAALLLPIMFFAKPKLPHDKEGWAALGISGCVGFGASFVLQGLGIARTSTTHAALIFALAPVITAILQFAQTRRWPQPLWWLGSAIASIGAVTLVFSRNTAIGGGTASIFGDLLVLIGTVTVSIGYLAGAKLSTKTGLFAATSWASIFGAAIVLPALPAVLGAVPHLTLVGASSIVFLVVFCTLLAFSAWFWAISNTKPGSIFILQFGQPLVSVLIAVVALSEYLSEQLLVAMILILAGVYLCRRGLHAS